MEKNNSPDVSLFESVDLYLPIQQLLFFSAIDSFDLVFNFSLVVFRKDNRSKVKAKKTNKLNPLCNEDFTQHQCLSIFICFLLNHHVSSVCVLATASDD